MATQNIRIEDQSEIQRIYSRLNEIQRTFDTVSKSSRDSLSTLSGIINGNGVDTTLNKLSAAIATGCNEIDKLIGIISDFIESQGLSYMSSKDQVVSELEQAQSNVDDIIGQIRV